MEEIIKYRQGKFVKNTVGRNLLYGWLVTFIFCLGMVFIHNHQEPKYTIIKVLDIQKAFDESGKGCYWVKILKTTDEQKNEAFAVYNESEIHFWKVGSRYQEKEPYNHDSDLYLLVILIFVWVLMVGSIPFT